MASANETDIRQLEQVMAADPGFKQLLDQYRSILTQLRNNQDPSTERQLLGTARQMDLQIKQYRQAKGWGGDATHDWQYSPDKGTFEKQGFFARNPILTAGLLAGGAFVGAGGIGALTGGAAPASGAAAGTDIGVNAATVPTESAIASGAWAPAGSLEGASTGGSVMGKVIGKDGILEPASKALSGYADNERENRQMKGNWVQDYDRVRLAAEQDQRTSESDAWKKALHTSYIQGGGRPYDASKAGIPYSYGFGPTAPSPYMQTAANTLQGQLMKRLSGEAKFQPTPLSEYAKPGVGERIGQYGSLATTGLDILGKFI